MSPDHQNPVPQNPVPQNPDPRLRWFTEARFGLFIHFGLYSILEGAWPEDAPTASYAEWIRHNAQIPIETYKTLAPRFNPTRFDADQWAECAAQAGMKYVVITTKHHDGFCLFPSKHTTWDVQSTPFQRDIMAEIANAFRKKGLRVGWYHSIMDWHHPDYLPRRDWELPHRPAEGADFDRFNTYLKDQVQELLTNYGQIDIMWFDGEWESTWTHPRGQDLYEHCRRLQPQIIVNNRVDTGRDGMAGFSPEGLAGDFGTPEQEVPPTGIPGKVWEACLTMNNNWGYNRDDHNWKSAEDLLKLLVDIVSKGGNFLLNVGPKPDGTFPQQSTDRLQTIGQWMKTNGEAIYATTASTLPETPWGRSTTKGAHRYLVLFQPPANQVLTIPKAHLPQSLQSDPQAHLLGQETPLETTQTTDSLNIHLPHHLPLLPTLRLSPPSNPR